jgi:hypothetical protein
MGEKLAWWLGITQPKFLFEIEEYSRIQKSEHNADDMAEQVTLGPDGKIRVVHTNDTALTTHFDLTARADTADTGRSQVYRLDSENLALSDKSPTAYATSSPGVTETAKLYGRNNVKHE